jgi:hypothetical protein
MTTATTATTTTTATYKPPDRAKDEVEPAYTSSARPWQEASLLRQMAFWRRPGLL